MEVGQRVRIHGKAVSGTKQDLRTQKSDRIDTFIYALSEAGRGWEKVLSYYADAETLTGTIVSVDPLPTKKSHVLIQLDADTADVATGEWAVKPYKRKDGTVAPNTTEFDKTGTIGTGYVYGLHLKTPISFSVSRNNFEIIE